MVFLPPDQSAQFSVPQENGGNNAPLYQTEGKFQVVTTTYDQQHFPTPAGDDIGCGGGGVTRYPEQEYACHYMSQSMILVQVNPGETFTIQAEDGTKCIQGPAQVPVVSPNGVIPPIHVPQGYISQVIEENGIRRVVVIPMPSAPFGTLQTQGMQHLSMHHAPNINYMQQMSMMPLNQQTPTYAPGEQVPIFHPQPLAYMQAEGSQNTEPPSCPPHYHQYQPPEMEPTNSSPRASKMKERLQKKFQERQNQEIHKNPSPTSTSPSSFSSYAATPSPNSSPDSSPRILSSSVPMYSNGYNTTTTTRKVMHPHSMQMQSHLLGSPKNYHQQYPSPSHSPNYAGSNILSNRNSKTQPQRSNTSEDMSSGSSSSGGSPRRLPMDIARGTVVPQESGHQYPTGMQQDAKFQPTIPKEAFPITGSELNLKEFLSAIVKPEVYETAPRSAHIKWSMRYCLPETVDAYYQEKKITYEIFLSDKGKDLNRFRSVHRLSETYHMIKDLKPGVEYHTRVVAELNSVKGSHSEITTFRTLSCPPDTPGAPKLMHRTKNSLTLKWAAPQDNGEKILAYHVEWDEGKKGSGFRSLYSENQKQYKVVRLHPSHTYTFRLSSVNKMGSSPWSPEVSYSTVGTVPNVPDPPRLKKASVNTIELVWTMPLPRAGEANTEYIGFTLEMDDGDGWKVIYDGGDLRHLKTKLTRSYVYKFRLCCYNSRGRSGFSSAMSYLTMPDRPGPPGKVMLKGKAHSTWFKVTWDPPKDNGGAEITKYVLECSHERGHPMNIIYSGPDREFSFDNCHPGLPHRLRVHCVSEGGVGLPCEVTVIVPPPLVPGPCAPPRSAAKARPSIISLKWDPPNYDGGTSVLAYELAMEVTHQREVEEANDPNAELQRSLKQVYNGPELDHAVCGLRPGLAYRFAVRAANKVGNGPWSIYTELETSAGPPEKPVVPEVEAVTSSSVSLIWKEPHDNGTEITGYMLEWGNGKDPMSTVHTDTCASHTFSYLPPNTTYYFRVQAQNAMGQSSFSDVVAVTTMPSCPGRVPRVWQGEFTIPGLSDQEQEDLGQDVEPEGGSAVCPTLSAIVEWEVPETNGSEVTAYTLEVTPVGKGVSKKGVSKPTDGDPVLVHVEDAVTTHLLEDLQPDSEYRIRVRAINEIGSGPFSPSVMIETQPLPPDPPILECSCSYNALKLKWGDSDSYDNFYLLQIKEKTGRFVTTYYGYGQSYRVKGLSERTTYQLRINGRNHAGVGPFSPTYSFTTSTAPPSQLKRLPSITVKQSYADILWDEVESIRGDPVSYIINMEDCEDPTGKQTFTTERPALRFGPLDQGSKYRLQVAAVRHFVHMPVKQPPVNAIKSSGASDEHEATSDAPEPPQDGDSRGAQDDEETIAEKDVPERKEIAGHFTNWITFEVPADASSEEEEDSRPVRKGDSFSGHLQSASSLLKVAPTSLSDERKGAVLLFAFFISAVLLAFLIQYAFL